LGWPSPTSRLVEDRTGWSIRKFVHTAHGCRIVQIRAGTHPSLPTPTDADDIGLDQ
jgi:hypothetical protein